MKPPSFLVSVLQGISPGNITKSCIGLMHQQGQLYFFVPYGPKSGRPLKMSVLCKFPQRQLPAQFLLSATPYSTKEKALWLNII